MLALLLLYAIAQGAFGETIPILSIETRDPSGNAELTYTRTVWDIFWGCLSTIFLCTWGSLHPNISSTHDEPGKGRLYKMWEWLVELLTYNLPLFLWALLVPEYILAWAIRQYITAGDIQKQVPGWTRAHGFFLIMGGFQLYQRATPDEERDSLNPGEFVRILDINDVRNNQLETIIPCTTQEDLKDRGKSDGIAKAIVLIQTSWFVIQCIARYIAGLPLTELEIATLAYAMINFFIYIFWWDKPRDVRSPIRVYEDVGPTYRLADRWRSGLREGIFHRMIVYIMGEQDLYVLISTQRKVPIFWSCRYGFGNDRGNGFALLGPSFLGMAFGAIHFIAWGYIFPSPYELIVWRTSCIVMVAVPFFSTIACVWFVSDQDNVVLIAIAIIPWLLFALSAWLYVVARGATIVIAFTSLRSLPSDAFVEVYWTTFIPHI